MGGPAHAAGREAGRQPGRLKLALPLSLTCACLNPYLAALPDSADTVAASTLCALRPGT